MSMPARTVSGTTSRVLRISLIVTAVYILLLVVAGLKAHSLALLSEAGHNLSDFFALLLSWGAVFLQARAPDDRKTFGYQPRGSAGRVRQRTLAGADLVLHLVRGVSPSAAPGGRASPD